MSAVSATLPNDTSTDANFRAWGSAISAALDTLGFPRTADTGQINWATVAHPAGSATSAGYEVRAFSDSNQAASPIFFKIEYGTGNISRPAIWATIGTGSDGAGTITATVPAAIASLPLARIEMGMNSGATTPSACYVVTDTEKSALLLLLWPNAGAGQPGSVFLLERTRDWNGNATSDGFLSLIWVTGLSRIAPINYNVATITNRAGSQFSFGPFGNASPLIKTTVQNSVCYPVQVPLPGGPRQSGPSKMLQLVTAGDLPANATYPLTVYGSNQTWLSGGGGSGTNPLPDLGYNSGGLTAWLARIT